MRHRLLFTIVLAAGLCAACTRSEPLHGFSPASDPAGERLAYLEYDVAAKSCRLVVQDAASRRVLDTGLDAMQLAWSPDGHTLAYSVWEPSRGTEIILRDMARGTKRSIGFDPNGLLPIGLGFLRDGRLAAAQGQRIVLFETAGSTATRGIDLAPYGLEPDFTAVSVSPRNVLAFAAGGPRRGIYTLPLDEPAAAPTRVTTDEDGVPAWLDDHTLVFNRAAGSLRRLWRLDLTTGRASELTHGDTLDTLPSKKGRRIVYVHFDPADTKELNDFLTRAQIRETD